MQRHLALALALVLALTSCATVPKTPEERAAQIIIDSAGNAAMSATGGVMVTSGVVAAQFADTNANKNAWYAFACMGGLFQILGLLTMYGDRDELAGALVELRPAPPAPEAAPVAASPTSTLSPAAAKLLKR